MKVHPIDPPDAPAATANTRNKYLCCWVLASLLVVGEALPILAFVRSNHKHNREDINKSPELNLDSLTASNFTVSSRPNQIHAAWNVGINLETTNTHGYLSFSNVTVSIYYNVLQAGLADVAAFDVVPLNSTRRFEVRFSGSSGLIDDYKVNDMNRRIAAGGTLAFDVVFEAYVKKSFGRRWTDHLQLVMVCKDINLFFGYSDKSRAQMLNPPHQCKIADSYFE